MSEKQLSSAKEDKGTVARTIKNESGSKVNINNVEGHKIMSTSKLPSVQDKERSINKSKFQISDDKSEFLVSEHDEYTLEEVGDNSKDIKRRKVIFDENPHFCEEESAINKTQKITMNFKYHKHIMSNSS